MRTIQEIQEAPIIELNKPKELSHGMKIHRVSAAEGGQLCFKLMSVRIPFAPSVFQGKGDEARKGITINLSSPDYARLEMISRDLRKQLEEICPDIEKNWSSFLKPAHDGYSSQLKAKINLKGDNCCKFFDSKGNVVSEPTNWRKMGECNVALRVGGIYHQSKNTGLLLEVTHIQYDPQAQEEQNPFM